MGREAVYPNVKRGEERRLWSDGLERKEGEDQMGKEEGEERRERTSRDLEVGGVVSMSVSAVRCGVMISRHD